MKLATWVYTTLASVVAGIVATRLVRLVWRIVAGRPAPTDPDDLAASTIQVTIFAAAVAAVAAAAQTLASRKALKAVRDAEARDLSGA
ncbi:MAG: DUF4235 domain-containing protein [Bifidobacteriaceae bacterium]|jgi:hypothetical protein|nr:DUF4235 domain-containing protein [Bifidobacteriaceae bacterium]